MARETRDIAYPIAFTGFILLVMTILVIDPDRMNGLTLAEYFWFYSTLLLTGVITFVLLLYVGREYRHNQVNNDRDFDCSDYWHIP